ncbi:hypothetical protein GPY51_21985 [Photorhabdus laumondii subsp. laumondii]|uniref:Uncharacterized protein n=1 Tax=Photorhabdus laumondii subsp. laumondii TaxID=141679 RepID=A0A6L9JUN1_PHOLM|nr:hypothetical protein [Photorhabdus laumondii]MCC8385321.1 hypothetical protein [Photorhabdus laumondii]MCC8414085.1 hypothetical protein [Photorhabdus laumondii]NDK96980.1 hypothetical protein [Photorhabdus laumondii subsp. laumondii]NDL23193.1 hypothetical protein [Photorhabdus laumondii subsp. laumondii]NDL32174.1 hypothetical protein [Photorhabdus laumondii subsp. laumondii]
MKLTNKDVYLQLVEQKFVQEIIKEYEHLYPFTENSIAVEYNDEFEQCSVWLGFEDQFAIRDAFGNWRQASAEECIALKNGSLRGTMKLIN